MPDATYSRLPTSSPPDHPLHGLCIICQNVLQSNHAPPLLGSVNASSLPTETRRGWEDFLSDVAPTASLSLFHSVLPTAPNIGTQQTFRDAMNEYTIRESILWWGSFCSYGTIILICLWEINHRWSFYSFLDGSLAHRVGEPALLHKKRGDRVYKIYRRNHNCSNILIFPFEYVAPIMPTKMISMICSFFSQPSSPVKFKKAWKNM